MAKQVKKDWFGRREDESYTHYDANKRLFNWDEGRKNYSSYFIRDDQGLKEAAKMVGSMFRVIGVPRTMNYKSQTKEALSSDAAKLAVPIPLGMLRNEDGSYMDNDTDLLDAFYGASIQNAALASMQTASEYKQTLIARSKGDKTTMKDLLFSVLNTERVDKKLSDRLPGYTRFIQKFKDHMYKNNFEELDPSEHAQKRLLELIVKQLRYPANISEADMIEFEKPVQAIERLMKRHGGLPDTADGCNSMAQSLATIIMKYEEKPPEEEPEPEDEDGEGDDKKETPPSSGGTPPPGKPKMDKSDLDDFAKDLMKNLVNPEEGEVTSDTIDEFQDFTEDMDDTGSPVKHNYDDKGEADDLSKVTFTKCKENKEGYMKALSKIDGTKAAVLAKLFSRKSKDYQFSMKSMRSGRLDTNKIAEAKQHVSTIYERMGSVKTDKITVGVLIDESGSMCGSKIQKAREAAVFINEVFKRMHDVQLFIYGHTADQRESGTTQIDIYREPGKHVLPFGLGTVEAKSNNRDGHAILAVAKRIRAQTENQGLLFVISDGQPAAQGYSGQAAIDDTRKKVTKAQSLGFQVIQIAIEESVPSAEMFDYYIKMTNIQNLPKDMIAYMSRKVDKLIKERVTI